jgi:hypothetical protein
MDQYKNVTFLLFDEMKVKRPANRFFLNPLRIALRPKFELRLMVEKRCSKDSYSKGTKGFFLVLKLSECEVVHSLPSNADK